MKALWKISVACLRNWKEDACVAKDACDACVVASWWARGREFQDVIGEVDGSQIMSPPPLTSCSKKL